MSRVNLAPHVTTAFHLGPLDLVPSMGFEETFYSESQTSPVNSITGQNQNQVVGTNLVRSARDFSLNIVFPPLVRIFPKKTIFGDKLKHVIEPRVTYRYVTGVGDEFSRFVRFDQTDLLADTNEVEISLTNRIYAKRGDSIVEIFTWELAQKRYFDPTFGGALLAGQPNIFTSTADVTGIAFLTGPRSYSPVVSTLRISPINGLGIRWQADYDPYFKHLTDSSFAVDYNKKKFVVSAGNDEIHTSPLLFAPANQFRARMAYGDPNHRDGMRAWYQSTITTSTKSCTRPSVDLQHRLLRLQRGIPPLQYRHPRRRAVARGVRDRQYRIVRDPAQAGPGILT